MKETIGDYTVETTIDVVTLPPGSVLLFRFADATARHMTGDDRERVSEFLSARLGEIPFIILSPDLDVTALIPSP